MKMIKFEICIRRKDGSDLYFEHLILDDLLNRNGCLYNPNTQEIVYKREFTGLLDKNGEEIYEGDLLRFKNFKKDYEQVYYEDGAFQMKTISKKYDDILRSRCTQDLMNDFKIIGNIYENPELLIK